MSASNPSKINPYVLQEYIKHFFKFSIMEIQLYFTRENMFYKSICRQFKRHFMQTIIKLNAITKIKY